MRIGKEQFSEFIRQFRFKELFNELGWNNDSSSESIVFEEQTFNLKGIAQKSGFKIFTCEPLNPNKFPDRSTRCKIETKVRKLFQEHLIIFVDKHKKQQIWQHVVRKIGVLRKPSEVVYNVSQEPELLYQKTSGLFFTLDEEEKVTIIDVTKRVADNFQQNNERVTKKFYDSFKKEHTAFLKFIKGISEKQSIDWYASLMLNRLMFCYFIQKKGFLDGNPNYLREKLNACKEKRGKNKFYSFYRDFLLALFHKGLGSPSHCKELELEIGRIPYLNGGLFDKHEIEKKFENITIEDQAFEKVFDFFDLYEWHLDTRSSASGRDINPDVIGYIFEKYINDRAQMGAYYTKEDITDYISKNCIVPWLFDEVKRQHPKAFAGDAWLWEFLRKSGDDYIYDAVKYGVPEPSELFDDLPPEVQKGFDPELEKKVVDGNSTWLWELRKDWNRPAPSDIALPTEIYREVIERRKRYASLVSKVSSGEIKDINDFITNNLNICQFALDVLDESDDADFIRHFYKALCSITILDPTCGSGAFLFSALNILEPLYEACIERMRDFVAQSEKDRYKYFEKILSRVDLPQHPNISYFIYKSIILNNIYGVDIMKEAVEIAKLRLFLKLVATVDADYTKANLGLEPLPDVDFNIRAGNTLVGYARDAEIEEAFRSRFDFDDDKEKIKQKCDVVARAFARYKEIQLDGYEDFDDFIRAKEELNKRLEDLRLELDLLLHKQQYRKPKFEKWQLSHQPFHWFAEFYEIIKERGGFDVVIGNPPYVEYSKVRGVYEIKGYETEKCGNLYAFVVERAVTVQNVYGRRGLIIPLSSVSTPRMDGIIKLYRQSNSRAWLSFYAGDSNPSTLFTGVKSQLSIHISQCQVGNVFSTNYVRWYENARYGMFERICYTSHVNGIGGDYLYKIGSDVESAILKKIARQKKGVAYYFRTNASKVFYYRNASGSYYRLFLTEPPTITVNGQKLVSTTLKEQGVLDSPELFVSLLSSTLFHWFWTCVSDNYHITLKEFRVFCIDILSIKKRYIEALCALCQELMNDYKKYSSIRHEHDERNKVVRQVQIYEPRASKPLIDRIDCILAQHYGFTHEELDYIINYDIKYRMGREVDLCETQAGY